MIGVGLIEDNRKPASQGGGSPSRVPPAPGSFKKDNQLLEMKQELNMDDVLPSIRVVPAFARVISQRT